MASSVEAALAAELDATVVVSGAVPLDGLVREIAGDAAAVTNARRRTGQASSLRVGIGWCAARGLSSDGHLRGAASPSRSPRPLRVAAARRRG